MENLVLIILQTILMVLKFQFLIMLCCWVAVNNG